MTKEYRFYRISPRKSLKKQTAATTTKHKGERESYFQS